ncbi:hypothetical protein [Agrilutibacter solisilvae]|uniref:Uncharacterized protein n=1 Tax=Agrilutibacter solisilvae TaxID=2763317 RepID=A0A975ARB8_9GAMM|nr:hypothetical protein [Lysobacter solisilvae]QSX77497.1 hypothetical protein I8J32_012120 [Lysobacter solisilvae]
MHTAKKVAMALMLTAAATNASATELGDMLNAALDLCDNQLRATSSIPANYQPTPGCGVSPAFNVALHMGGFQIGTPSEWRTLAGGASGCYEHLKSYEIAPGVGLEVGMFWQLRSVTVLENGVPKTQMQKHCQAVLKG